MDEAVLIVDDEPNILNALRRVFRTEGYEILTAGSAQEALEVLSRREVCLVISDHRMPGMTGVELLKEVKQRYPETLRIILSGYTNPETIASAINEGEVHKFISKPWAVEDLKATVCHCLSQHRLTRENRRLQEAVAAQNEDLRRLAIELKESYMATVQTIVALLELRDPFSRGHSERVCKTAAALGRRAGVEGDDLWVLETAARLHNIGNVGVECELLHKPGGLTTAEQEEVRQHPLLGWQVLSGHRWLQPVATLIRHHHERWDGSGYPDGLAGEAIPLGSRIIAVADAYRAMEADRSYRPRLDLLETCRALEAGSGKQFDPRLVDLLLAMIREEEKSED